MLIFFDFAGSSLAGQVLAGQANGRTHMKYSVYILQSLKDGGYYVGMTEDLLLCLKYHNSRRVRSTKSRTPFKLVYSEEFSEMLDAREREKHLKSYKGSREKLSILEKL